MAERKIEKKKRKLEDENRQLQSEWENLYFFIYVTDNAECLICRHSISILKSCNLKRHYEQKHGEIDKLTVGERKAKLQSLKNNLTSQQYIFHKQTAQSNGIVSTSFRVFHIIAKNMKPFTDGLMSRRTLTFSEIFSKTKSLIQELWKTPPTHPWYNRQAPGGALSIKADRVVQTTISRLASGHIRGLSFNLGQKIYENCTKCNLVQATPDHLLFCAGLEREDIYSSPLLVYDFLRTLGLMDLV
ncbi:RNase H domain-containing protein [Trichonephila clavipes]|nr:RNase H domain-containing protein [Trichonephila clavipes]